jgi:hypothetical protein
VSLDPIGVAVAATPLIVRRTVARVDGSTGSTAFAAGHVKRHIRPEGA